jgi:hypothetical protein
MLHPTYLLLKYAGIAGIIIYDESSVADSMSNAYAIAH